MKQDLRETTRFLARNPGFAAVIVITLGLAIGVNSTIFSVLNGVLLRPLDYDRPNELVGLWESNPGQGQERAQVAAATYLDWRERTKLFSSIGLYRYHGYTLTGTGEPERLITVDVSPALFKVLGVPTVLGRTFTDEEERPGEQSRKVVLSHRAWVQRFGRDPRIRWLRADDPANLVGPLGAELGISGT